MPHAVSSSVSQHLPPSVYQLSCHNPSARSTHLRWASSDPSQYLCVTTTAFQVFGWSILIDQQPQKNVELLFFLFPRENASFVVPHLMQMLHVESTNIMKSGTIAGSTEQGHGEKHKALTEVSVTCILFLCLCHIQICMCIPPYYWENKDFIMNFFSLRALRITSLCTWE